MAVRSLTIKGSKSGIKRFLRLHTAKLTGSFMGMVLQAEDAPTIELLVGATASEVWAAAEERKIPLDRFQVSRILVANGEVRVEVVDRNLLAGQVSPIQLVHDMRESQQRLKEPTAGVPMSVKLSVSPEGARLLESASARMKAKLNDPAIDIRDAYLSPDAQHAESHADRLPLVFRGFPREFILGRVFDERTPVVHCILCQAERLLKDIDDDVENEVTFEEVFAACLFRWSFMLPIQRVSHDQSAMAVKRLGRRNGTGFLHGSNLPAIRTTTPRNYWVGGNQFLFGSVPLGKTQGGLGLFSWSNGAESTFTAWGGVPVGSPMDEALTTEGTALPDLSKQEAQYLGMLYAISHRVASAAHTLAAPTEVPQFYLGAKVVTHLKERAKFGINAQSLSHWAALPFLILTPQKERGGPAPFDMHPVWMNFNTGQAKGNGSKYRDIDPELQTLPGCPIHPGVLVHWLEEQRLPNEPPFSDRLPALVVAQQTPETARLYLLLEP